MVANSGFASPKHLIETRLLAYFFLLVAIATFMGFALAIVWTSPVPHLTVVTPYVDESAAIAMAVSSAGAAIAWAMAKGVVRYHRRSLATVFIVVVAVVSVHLGLSIAANPGNPDWVFGYISLLIVGVSIIQVARRWWIIAVLIIWGAWVLAAIPSDIGDGWRIGIPMVSIATLTSAYIMYGMRHQESVYSREIDRTIHDTNIDPLTKTLNRRGALYLFHQRINSANNVTAAAYFVDLNGLKTINDTFGHADGDQAIAAVADALRYTTRVSSDIVCRWGGDEFVIFALDPLDVGVSADAVENRINTWLAEHNPITSPWTPSVSVGIANADTLLGPPDDLVAAADSAMYERRRKNR